MGVKIWVGASVFVFLLILPLATTAQPAEKAPRIAFLAGGSRAGDVLLIEAFWRRMKDLGYVEGHNIVAEYRFAEGVPERLPHLAAEVVRLNVNVIVGPGSGARAAKKATDTIPIVMTYGDPLGDGLAASLARPGGNVTGLSGFVAELGGKQLELLKEAFPKVSRVAVLWRTDANAPVLEHMKVTAGGLRMTLQPLALREITDFAPAFAAIKTEGAQGLIALRSPLTATHRMLIVEFAARNRLPAIYSDREFAGAGGLMSYGVSVTDLWARSAVYVDKILKGAKPAELPIEQPQKFELVINLKTARTTGLAIPSSLLLRADEVIE